MPEDHDAPQPAGCLLLFLGWVTCALSLAVGSTIGGVAGLFAVRSVVVDTLYCPTVWLMAYLVIIYPSMLMVQEAVQKKALSTRARALWTLSPALLPIPVWLVAAVLMA